MTPGYATPAGTAGFADRFPAHFYRTFDDLTLSTLGLGTYLGNADEATDRAYEQAIEAAVRGGVNLLDAAINYRNQHSERSIGAALALFQREQIFVCTKAGFLTPDAVPSFLKPADIVGGMHSMTPEFLADQIDRSRANLGLETIDVFYLHNPETQLGFVPRSEFDASIRRAFVELEASVTAGKIRYYGTATWNGYRVKPDAADALHLTRLIEIARDVAGDSHHFRFIQLPFNLGMVEALVQGGGLLETAERAGISVIASASLLQGRLASNLPEVLAEKIPSLATDAQRAIQFTRSTPGITTALVGMSKAVHVAENLGVQAVAPLAREAYDAIFQPA
ncbi:MAG: aldo/keto reductase [Candidatus Solibacter usitatus]|nr:aldo/keto reductase [Candidatus Solibacter usitatus]